MNDSKNLDTEFLFASPIYKINEQSFLKSCLTVFDEKIEQQKASSDFKFNEIYPVIMTDNLFDERLEDFFTYINQTAWNILDSQGYDMSCVSTFAREAWGQQHHKYSSMEYHYHQISILSGFYILSAPKNSSGICFHDPRLHKQFEHMLPLKSQENISLASSLIFYEPKDGDIYFTNSWFPHSFTRNQSEDPFKFIHFNIYCEFQPQCNPPVIV